MNKAQNRSFKLINLIVCLLLLFGSAEAKNALDLSTAGVGARPLAMGRAFTAVADDVNAVFLNPAGLGEQKNWAITTMSTRLLERTDYKLAGVVCPTNYGTLGIGYLLVSTPGGYLTTDKISISSLQAITYASNAFIFSYGRELNEIIKLSDKMGKLSVGASLKTITNRFDGTDNSGSGTSTSLGIKFRPNQQFSYGLNFQNASGSIDWKSGTKEQLPLTTSLGGAYYFDRGLTSVDMEFGSKNSYLHGGVEYCPINSITLRAGVDQSPASQTDTVYNLTGGVGVKLSGFNFDYAYQQDNTLVSNSTHYVSISFQPVSGWKPEKKVTVEQKAKVSTKEIKGMDGIYHLNREKTAFNYYDTIKQDGVFHLAQKRNSEKAILSYYEK